jgi:hypothetical protein
MLVCFGCDQEQSTNTPRCSERDTSIRNTLDIPRYPTCAQVIYASGKNNLVRDEEGEERALMSTEGASASPKRHSYSYCRTNSREEALRCMLHSAPPP